MKTSTQICQVTVLLLILGAIPQLAAQNSSAPLSAGQISANEATLEAWDAQSQPIGPNHRTTFRNTPSGQHRIVELTTGMNYWDGQEWRPSDPVFAADQDGFFAGKTQHQVHLANDLSASNSVEIVTPEGIELNSTPVGVALYDAASGNFSVIASITNCAGQLAASNQVIYPDAFSGGVCADVVYTITKGTFHQDVVFTGSLDPADYGFPDATTRIQILTEFHGAPAPDVLVNPLYVESNPQVRQGMVSPDLIDQELGFGRFVMTQGKAYVAPSADITNGVEALVAKEYVNIDGVNYLVESVPYASIATALSALPACHPSLGMLQPKISKGFAGLPHPGKHFAERTNRGRPIQTGTPGLQARNSREHGVVVDYVANIAGTMSGTIVFQSDTTYLVSGSVTWNGTAILEGGSVFKYKPLAYDSTLSLSTGATLTANTGMYRPAIFTAVDDDTVGDTMRGITNSEYTGQTSTNYYANPALLFDGNFANLNIGGLRFRYARAAVTLEPTASNKDHFQTFSDCQFLNCNVGINIYDSFSEDQPVDNCNVCNCLFSQVSDPFCVLGTGSVDSFFATVAIVNSTIDSAPNLANAGLGGDLYLYATNCIFSSITNWGNFGYGAWGGANNGFFNNGGTAFGTSKYSVSTTPYQTVGAGNYYLTSASGFQSYGITNGLPATLITALGQRTTYPPQVTLLTTQVTSLVISPQALRDTAVQSLGYHYDPLDQAFGGVYLTNSTVTINGGAAIATFGVNGSAFGLGIGSGSSLSSVGAPNAPNWIALYNMVMEGTNNWSRPTNSVTGELLGATPAPSIYTRFTFWSVPVQDAPQFYAPVNTGPICFQDSEFHGGKLISYAPTIDLTNCLLERVYANLASTDGHSPWIQNCLFRGGTFDFAPNVSTATVENNLFDSTSISNNSSLYTTYYGGCNGYVTNYSRLLPTNAWDRILTASPAYQTSFLGFYYLPTNSPLIQAGSTNANFLGLYHYTTQTNQAPETNAIVDIGYHYVATDAYGNPLDSNGDGVPDYLEDANGDGIFNAGDVANWRAANFSGGTLAFPNGVNVLIFEPKPSTLIP